MNEDEVDEETLFEADLNVRKHNKKHVLNEGYESDSSEEKEEDEGEKKGKKIRFIELEEIEGQEFNSMKIKNEEEDDDEEEIFDEELGASGRKKNPPKMEAFNMKEDYEEGRFDEDGNYIRNAPDLNAKHDIWLEGIKKTDILKAKEAVKRREEEKRRWEKQEEKEEWRVEKMYEELLDLLEMGETVLEGLQRLGRGMEGKKAKKKVKREINQETVQRIERMTELADRLMQEGCHDIYDLTREAIVRLYEKQTGRRWEKHRKEEKIQYEYKWKGKEEIYKGYEREMIQDWYNQGFFTDETVEIRREGEEKFKTLEELGFFLKIE